MRRIAANHLPTYAAAISEAGLRIDQKSGNGGTRRRFEKRLRELNLVRRGAFSVGLFLRCKNSSCCATEAENLSIPGNIS